MTRINRTFVVAAAAIGMSTGAVAMVPTVISPTIAVMPTASAGDVTGMYNAAQLGFRTGDIATGLNALRRLLAANPSDRDALALQALWSDYNADRATTQAAVNALRSVDPARAAAISRALTAVGTGVLVGPDPVPRLLSPSTGIVLIGVGPPAAGGFDGEMTARLVAAWLQAVAAPRSPIIVVGNNPGVREWLTTKAIASSMIHVEPRATTLVQSALLGAEKAAELRLRDVVLVTSPDQVRRAAVDFQVAGVTVARATTTITDLFAHVAVPAKVDQWDIYLDASRVLGLPDTRG
ncbi:YdcF family protein [Williamsia muralis]|uniref:YdcF family protein n=1 Tax=Williamsia marianensis TaxID=85044 RepID=UPI003F184E50